MFLDKLFLQYENVIVVFRNITVLSLQLNKSLQTLYSASHQASDL